MPVVIRMFGAETTRQYTVLARVCLYTGSQFGRPPWMMPDVFRSEEFECVFGTLWRARPTAQNGGTLLRQSGQWISDAMYLNLRYLLHSLLNFRCMPLLSLLPPYPQRKPDPCCHPFRRLSRTQMRCGGSARHRRIRRCCSRATMGPWKARSMEAGISR